MIPDDLFLEILTRLSVKSLMRFKCVCRNWLSTITDPSFTDHYPGHSCPRLHSVVRVETNLSFLFSRLCGCDGYGILPDYTTGDHDDKNWKAHTNVANGLLCFYQYERSWLYNITTREMVRLPDFPTIPNLAASGRPYFGFDPISKKYKLIKICDPTHVAILTIGVGSSWRIIRTTLPITPKETFAPRASCFGGTLCWMQPDYRQIIAFNLHEEMFIHINPLPFQTLDLEPPMRLINFGSSIVISELGDGTARRTNAMLRNLHGRRFRIPNRTRPDRILHYDDVMENWIEGMLPRRIPGDIVHPILLGVLPNGKRVVYDKKKATYFHWSRWLSYEIHLFDPSTKGWEKHEMKSSSRFHLENASNFEENIISLARLIGETGDASQKSAPNANLVTPATQMKKGKRKVDELFEKEVSFKKEQMESGSSEDISGLKYEETVESNREKLVLLPKKPWMFAVKQGVAKRGKP